MVELIVVVLVAIVLVIVVAGLTTLFTKTGIGLQVTTSAAISMGPTAPPPPPPPVAIVQPAPSTTAQNTRVQAATTDPALAKILDKLADGQNRELEVLKRIERELDHRPTSPPSKPDCDDISPSGEHITFSTE